MTIMQMLFFGGNVLTTLDPYLTTANVTRPKVTVIPSDVYESSSIDTTDWLNATIEVWGGGGASGSAFRGQSGNGGGGGYISGLIPIRDLGITQLFVRVGGGGGGPADGDPNGTPTYYDIPSDEYQTSFGSNSAFSNNTGGCGGSSGGFSGIFAGTARTPLLIAAGGGGGGGSSSSGGAGGAGGAGGGSAGSSGTGGTPGGGGGAGTQSAGGSAGTASGTNSGEVGVAWNEAAVGGFLTGGRGANSPVTDTTTIPRFGANATGGYGRGSGGGSSRTTSTNTPVADPTNCGGAGGGGYYGGGGGAAGNGGGGGGGGGGSNYASPDVSVIDNFSGAGIVPGNIISDNYVAGFGYGGLGVSASGSDVEGNPGFSGMVVISFTLAL